MSDVLLLRLSFYRKRSLFFFFVELDLMLRYPMEDEEPEWSSVDGCWEDSIDRRLSTIGLCIYHLP